MFHDQANAALIQLSRMLTNFPNTFIQTALDISYFTDSKNHQRNRSSYFYIYYFVFRLKREDIERMRTKCHLQNQNIQPQILY